MNFTKISLAKLNWLMSSKEFRRNPFRVGCKIFGWEVIRRLNRGIEYRYDGDLTIFLYPNDGVARLTYYFGFNEPDIFRFLGSFLREGMTYFDAGANIGLYSIFAAKRVGAAGKVFAFEPQAETFARLLENIESNKFNNVLAEKKALGNRNGLVSVHRNNNDSARSFTSAGSLDSAERVEVITLDDYMDEKRIETIDYLKIDVEGFENNVLLGAVSLLKYNPPKIIQIELYEEFLRRNGSSVSAVENLLRGLGYSFFRVDGRANKLRSVAKELGGDLFLINDSHLANLAGMIIR